MQTMTAWLVIGTVLGLAATGCGAESGEPTGVSADSVTLPPQDGPPPTGQLTCPYATADAVRNASADQATEAFSKATYDNPKCQNMFVVDFDGTINGVHVGYKLATPHAGAPTEGIRIEQTSFPVMRPEVPGYSCGDHISMVARLYEKQSPDGKYVFKESRGEVAHGDTEGVTHADVCALPVITFSDIEHGTADNPHIYRVAVSTMVDDGSGLSNKAIFSNYPDDLGIGFTRVRGCDATHYCNTLP